MKLRSFKQYREDRDAQDVGPEPMGPGMEQSDPDKPDKSNDLISALEDIVSIANRALSLRNKGLGDLSGNGKPNEEESDDASLNKTIARPKSDNAEGMFGGE